MELFSRTMGEGRPLVILHGLFGSSDNWQSLALRFSSFFQVHLIDLRNHGRSPWSDVHTYEAMVFYLKDYFEKHRLAEAFLLGHSMGGKVAMFFSQQHPRFISKLVVADMGIKEYPMHHQHVLSAIHALDLTQLKTRVEGEHILERHLENAGVRQFLLKNLYRETKDSFAWRMNVVALERSMPEILCALPSIESWIPTLFLRGSLSNYILDQDIPSIESVFPDSQTKTLEGAGHWLHAEQPEMFFDEVMGFLLR
jgi:pimeloyl-ACP methyl ester carboxylesterase